MGPTPTVTIHVFGQLRTYCGDSSELSISASTVADALEALGRQHPVLYRHLCDETGAGASSSQCLRQLGPHARARPDRHEAGPRRRGQLSASRLRGVNLPDRVVLTVGTKKGVFVAEGAKPRRRFTLRGPFGPGVPAYASLIDTRGTPRLYALELRSVLRDEGPAVDGSGQELQGDEIGAGLSEGRRTRPQEHLGAGAGRDPEGALVWRRAGVPLQEHGRWRFVGDGDGGSATTRTPASGSRAAAVSVFTRSCATGAGCISGSRPEVTT